MWTKTLWKFVCTHHCGYETTFCKTEQLFAYTCIVALKPSLPDTFFFVFSKMPYQQKIFSSFIFYIATQPTCLNGKTIDNCFVTY